MHIKDEIPSPTPNSEPKKLVNSPSFVGLLQQ